MPAQVFPTRWLPTVISFPVLSVMKCHGTVENLFGRRSWKWQKTFAPSTFRGSTKLSMMLWLLISPTKWRHTGFVLIGDGSQKHNEHESWVSLPVAVDAWLKPMPMQQPARKISSSRWRPMRAWSMRFASGCGWSRRSPASCPATTWRSSRTCSWMGQLAEIGLVEWDGGYHKKNRHTWNKRSGPQVRWDFWKSHPKS